MGPPAFQAWRFPKLLACKGPILGYLLRSAAPETPAVAAEPRHLMAAANDLRKGMAILHNGEVAVVLDVQHRTPGNLRAFVQASLRSLRDRKSVV